MGHAWLRCVVKTVLLSFYALAGNDALVLHRGVFLGNESLRRRMVPYASAVKLFHYLVEVVSALSDACLVQKLFKLLLKLGCFVLKLWVTEFVGVCLVDLDIASTVLVLIFSW